MKKMYWRPPGLSKLELLLIAAVSIASLLAVENFPREQPQPNYAEKMAATRLAQSMMSAVREAKISRGIHIDPEIDPANTGMVGSVVTPITSNTGYLESKLTSTNPNFAAVVIHMLKRANVQEGDVVAVGLSGSFPALNASTFAALQVLKVVPVVIASAASSEWGATDTNYLWLDMEQTLIERRLVGFRSIAASRGGVDDRGFGISKRGRQLLDEAIQRAEIHRPCTSARHPPRIACRDSPRPTR
jgi:poly-gamma-glutamate system protein